MDPVTAIGAVSAAITLFEFTKILIRDASTVLDRGELSILTTHEKVAQDLAKYVRQFEDRTSTRADGKLSEDEIALRELSWDCGRVAQELLEMLRPLRPRTTNGEMGRMDSLAIAAKAMMKRSAIEHLSKQIENYRTQIHVRAQAILGQKTLDEIQGGFTHQDKAHKDLLQRIEQQKMDLDKQNRDLSAQLEHLTRIIDTPSLLEVTSATPVVEGEGLRRVSQAHYEALLKHLHFRQMESRRVSIKEAHKETYEWIFRAPSEEDGKLRWSDFPAWLRSGSGCYWVQGKPGAGKSTLMKFIHQHKQYGHNLKQWSGTKPLVMASFFFWYAGTTLQKSQEGMLRNILYQLIKQCPEFIPHMMDEPSIEISKLASSPLSGGLTLQELTRWFRLLAEASRDGKIPHRICLLVDGLDEFEGSDKEISDFFVDISQVTHHIKVVLASRPHSAFVAGLSSYPGLRLQDFTRDDIRIYAGDRLSEIHQKKVSELLVRNIASQSQGVFLWVALVTGNLRDMYHDGATVAELETQLLSMPSEISSLYQRILQQIPENYQSEAAKMIQMMMSARQKRGSLDVEQPVFVSSDVPMAKHCLAMWFALDKGTQILTMASSHPPWDDLVQMDKRMVSRFRSRCLGLLETRKNVENIGMRSLSHVDFVHRSCYEFFSTGYNWNHLRQMSPESSFRIDHSWFLGYLGILTVRKPPLGQNDALSCVLSWARKCELSHTPIPFELLDAFEQSFRLHSASKEPQSQGADDQWSVIDYLAGGWDKDRGQRFDLFLPHQERIEYNYNHPDGRHRRMTDKEKQYEERLGRFDISAQRVIFGPEVLTHQVLSFLYLALDYKLYTYLLERLIRMDHKERVFTATHLVFLYFQLSENMRTGARLFRPESFNWNDSPLRSLLSDADPNYRLTPQTPLWAVPLVMSWKLVREGVKKPMPTDKRLQNEIRITFCAVSDMSRWGADMSVGFHYGDRDYSSALDYLDACEPLEEPRYHFARKICELYEQMRKDVEANVKENTERKAKAQMTATHAPKGGLPQRRVLSSRDSGPRTMRRGLHKIVSALFGSGRST